MTTATHRSGGVSLAEDIQNRHHISCPPASFCTVLPRDAVCSIAQHLGHRPHFLPGLFSLTLDLWVSADACVDLALKSTGPCQNLFRACLQSSVKAIALQQLPKQSQWAECLQCWDSKALLLGQDIRHSLFFPCFHQNSIQLLCNI